ncbi:hypothetical protein Hs30E_09110 [Lactococcus hodotermopsidis]|uniref:DUF86 domain-containing protein n=1 Tax=Pseudolactococcus hodotermopsidis TaxID=2709157 RepID=A0A6A0BA80_9LACT|nr:hypothetical protein [Lactococcus hodotermopsidis]GFH42360.1 hypothetical protein Hs30E_09110 [Lactococcus hodotermopsidis]
MRNRNEIEEDILFLKTMIYYANEVERKFSLVNLKEDSLEQEMFLDSVALMIGQFGEQLDRSKLSYASYIKYRDKYPLHDMKQSRHDIYHEYGTLALETLVKHVKVDMPKWVDDIHRMIRDLEKELEKR